MTRLNYIERLKDSLYATDYKAIKHSEGLISDEDYQDIKDARQSIRDEINRIEAMTDAEYEEEFNDAPSEDFEPSEEPYDINIVTQNNEEEENFDYDGV